MRTHTRRRAREGAAGGAPGVAKVIKVENLFSFFPFRIHFTRRYFLDLNDWIVNLSTTKLFYPIGN